MVLRKCISQWSGHRYPHMHNLKHKEHNFQDKSDDYAGTKSTHRFTCKDRMSQLDRRVDPASRG